jgi:threonine aldolase
MTQAEMPDIVDLRSDTVTTPTPEMRRAMAEAEVGDDAYGEDPTVNRLEALAAALTGKPAALYVASGTMANQLAMRALGRPGTEVLCGERAHVYRYEHAAAAGNGGVQLRPLPDSHGVINGAVVRDAVDQHEHHLPEISMVTIENTHMPASGRAWHLDELRDLTEAAATCGLRVHCDGARIWNAAIARGESPAVLVESADTVMFCLSKGLGAPIGSLLCGPVDVISQAREDRSRLGGGWRQAGVLAAAGIVALETMVERLADDHARARQLAEALETRFPGSIESETVETNIVCATAARLPEKVVARLDARGVRCGTIDSRTVRFVTHKDVDDEGVQRAVAALDEIVKEGS